MGDEPTLAIERRLTRFGLHMHITAIRQQFAGIDRIGQNSLKHLLANGIAQRQVFDREERFDTTIQVALHHIGASQIDLLVTIVAKVVDAAVLQETPQHTPDANIITDARQTRTQAAYAAHIQINADACLRGPIEQVNDLRIDKRIHFEDQAAVAILLLHMDLALNTLYYALPQCYRRH